MSPRRSHNADSYLPGHGHHSSGWFRDDALFLTDGRRAVRYRELPQLIHTADQHLQNHHPDIVKSWKDDPTPQAWFGIDTTRRFEAILWMVYCWVRNIPFVPFAHSYMEPVSLLQPDFLVLTTPETKTVLATAGMSSADGNKPVSGILLAPNILPDQPAAGKPDDAMPDLPVGFLDDLFDQPDGLFCGLTTSGSSSRPKRVALLRRNMIAAAINAFMDDDRHRDTHARTRTPDDGSMNPSPDSKGDYSRDNTGDHSGNNHLWGNCLPLYHTGGLTIVFRALLNGTGLYLWDRFDPQVLVRDIKECIGIQRISLVPTMLLRLLDFCSKDGISPPDSLDMVLIGGGPAEPKLIYDAQKAGWPVCFSYGMTETCGQIAAQTRDGPDPHGSVGKPFPGHEVMITDEHGRQVQRGKSGLLRIRGPQVLPGYLNADRQIIASGSGPDPQGWFETGDYARMDVDGHLFIEARRTDLIISGGQNVNPVEVEDILRKCPQISDVAVTGISDEGWGQIVVAFIVPDESTVGGFTVDESTTRENFSRSGDSAFDKKQKAAYAGLKSAVNKFAEGNLRPHQRPKRLLFISSIPRTSLGKTERNKLQEMATDLLA